MSEYESTIYAPITGSSQAAVAIIRVSGPDAFLSLNILCNKPAPLVPLQLNALYDPESGKKIDTALILTFSSPASFTGEDVVEYHIHGGRAVMRALLTALSGIDGHRMADPGEFTRRAFENGKMDLTSAEAVHDLVTAETEAQHEQALAQIDGRLARLYEDWRADLIKTAAYIEATIDFSEEELPFDKIKQKISPSLAKIYHEIEAHLNDARRGERLREGIKIAVIGAPNSGKSSLVNLLANKEVSIISSIAGTTRDLIETHLNLGGYPAIIIDTAGLRPADLGNSAQDAIEGEGIRRALKASTEADLRLLLFDYTQLPDLHKDTVSLVQKNSVLVINKCDLAKPDCAGRESGLGCPIPQEIAGLPVNQVSVLSGAGIPALLTSLKNAIEELIGINNTNNITPTRARHRESLEQALAAIAGTDILPSQEQRHPGAEPPPEIIAEHLRLAAHSLGRITGRVDVEDMLDVIFRDFCIGK